jgi:hypothetical protein
LPQRRQSSGWTHTLHTSREPVRLVTLEPGILSVRHLSQALARSLAERLPFLRRIDAVDADFVLALVGIQHGDRVAVG